MPDEHGNNWGCSSCPVRYVDEAPAVEHMKRTGHEVHNYPLGWFTPRSENPSENPVDVIKLPHNIDVEAWFDPDRERIVLKVRRCPTGEIRDGKQGLKFSTTLDGMFDIAEGEIYPFVHHHNMTERGKQG